MGDMAIIVRESQPKCSLCDTLCLPSLAVANHLYTLFFLADTGPRRPVERRERSAVDTRRTKWLGYAHG
jgi:hypothetical protein